MTTHDLSLAYAHATNAHDDAPNPDCRGCDAPSYAWNPAAGRWEKEQPCRPTSPK